MLARLVKLTKTGPMKIEPTDKPVWVCACGLSQNFPMCDGAHKGCVASEPEAGAVYVYDDERKRVVEVRRDDSARG